MVATLLLVVFLVYQPALRCGFIWDDDDHLTNNPAVNATDGLTRIWTSLEVARYYPLTLTHFWLLRRVWGLQPLPYHAVNIALHAANAILLWHLLRQLRVRGAGLAALLWAVHPVNVETVAWVTEMKNTQSGLFFLLALVSYLRFDRVRRWSWYWLALVFFMGAVLSKSATVILPLVLLLCLWWRRGQWRWREVVRVLPFFVIAAAMALLTVAEQRGHISREATPEWGLSCWERLVLAGRAVVFYAGKLIWPAPLIFVYPRWELRAVEWRNWLPWLGWGVGVIGLWRGRKQKWAPAVIFGVAYFVVALLPVLGFFDVYYFRYSFVADHFQYLASAGGITGFAVGLTLLLERALGGRPWLGQIGCGAWVVVLASLSWRQGGMYANDETLFRTTIDRNPQCWMACENLGNILVDHGQVDEAIALYQQALKIRPDHELAYYDLGIALAGRGQVDAAIAQYRQALILRPDYAEAHNNLGALLAGRGQVDAAIAQYRQALILRPDYAKAHNNLGIVMADRREFPAAIREYRQALKIQPDYAKAYNNLGVALARSGRVAEAIDQFQKAFSIRADYAEAHNNLGNTLAGCGRVDAAIREYRQALAIQPDYAKAHNNLGVALVRSGQFREAIAHYEKALELQPDFPEARRNLAAARKKLPPTGE